MTIRIHAGVAIRDIRVMLRLEMLSATQSYLLENPMRYDEQLRAFTIAL